MSERNQKKANGSNFVRKVTNNAMEIMTVIFQNVKLRNSDKKGIKPQVTNQALLNH